MARTTRKILGFTMDEWNSIGAEAGRKAREARFRKGLPVVVEVEGVPMYEYPDGTFKTVAEYDAEEQRAAGERQAS